MKTIIKILLTLFIILSALQSYKVAAEELAGRWQGELQVNPAMSIALTFNFTKTGSGYTATLDVPVQQQYGLPFDQMHVSSNVITLALTKAGISYQGEISDNEIKGTYSQSGSNFTLNLHKINGTTQLQPPKNAPARVQEPTTTAYLVEQVTFTNPIGGHQLAGTLSTPRGNTSHAVVLLSGSGPSTRDGLAFGHKIFLVLSDLLVKQGVAVLRFDDRGVGESGGNHQSATSFDFATDANAAITFMRQHPRLTDTKLGLVGHSEGGLIAAIAGAENKAIDFIISLAGPGTSGEQILIDQSYEIQRLMGVSKAALEASDKIQKQILQAIVQDKSRDELQQMMFDASMNEQEIGQQLAQIDTPWFRTFVKTNPATYLAKIKVPVLALNGGKDVQVLAIPNIDGFQKHTNTHLLTTKVYDNLNHLFQPAQTGLPNEYAQSDITFSVDVVYDMVDWLNQL